MEHAARRIVARVAVIVPATVIAAILLVALPGAPPLPNASAHYAGAGVTTTPEQHVTDGWYEVRWTASAADRPIQGCLFGLRLDPRQPDASPDPREWRRYWPLLGNLVYRTVPRNGTLSGSSGAIRLEAGTYRFVVDGWCAWDVVMAPTEAPPEPSPSRGTSLEQAAP